MNVCAYVCVYRYRYIYKRMYILYYNEYERVAEILRCDCARARARTRALHNIFYIQKQKYQEHTQKFREIGLGFRPFDDSISIYCTIFFFCKSRKEFGGRTHMKKMWFILYAFIHTCVRPAQKNEFGKRRSWVIVCCIYSYISCKKETEIAQKRLTNSHASIQYFWRRYINVYKFSPSLSLAVSRSLSGFIPFSLNFRYTSTQTCTQRHSSTHTRMRLYVQRNQTKIEYAVDMKREIRPLDFSWFYIGEYTTVYLWRVMYVWLTPIFFDNKIGCMCISAQEKALAIYKTMKQ